MLKGYISRWKRKEKPEDNILDYWFCTRPGDAAYWGSREEAENDCVVFNRHQRIVIPSSQGGTYVCQDFKVEERKPGEFVVFCIAPFIPKDSVSGELSSTE